MLTIFVRFCFIQEEKTGASNNEKRTEDTMWDKKESLNYKKFIKNEDGK